MSVFEMPRMIRTSCQTPSVQFKSVRCPQIATHPMPSPGGGGGGCPPPPPPTPRMATSGLSRVWGGVVDTVTATGSVGGPQEPQKACQGRSRTPGAFPTQAC